MSLEDLFKDTSEEEFLSLGMPKNVSMIRCKCGNLVSLRLPCVCSQCNDPKAYWRMLDGSVLPLSKMDLGHLTNTVKMLAAKTEEYPQGQFRQALEIAIDLFYAEIGSRDKEIAQASGIMAALQRSLANSSVPEE